MFNRRSRTPSPKPVASQGQSANSSNGHPQSSTSTGANQDDNLDRSSFDYFLSDPSHSESEVDDSHLDHQRKLLYRQRRYNNNEHISHNNWETNSFGNTSLSSSNVSPMPLPYRFQFESNIESHQGNNSGISNSLGYIKEDVADPQTLNLKEHKQLNDVSQMKQVSEEQQQQKQQQQPSKKLLGGVSRTIKARLPFARMASDTSDSISSIDFDHYKTSKNSLQSKTLLKDSDKNTHAKARGSTTAINMLDTALLPPSSTVGDLDGDHGRSYGVDKYFNSNNEQVSTDQVETDQSQSTTLTDLDGAEITTEQTGGESSSSIAVSSLDSPITTPALMHPLSGVKSNNRIGSATNKPTKVKQPTKKRQRFSSSKQSPNTHRRQRSGDHVAAGIVLKNNQQEVDWIGMRMSGFPTPQTDDPRKLSYLSFSDSSAGISPPQFHWPTFAGDCSYENQGQYSSQLPPLSEQQSVNQDKTRSNSLLINKEYYQQSLPRSRSDEYHQQNENYFQQELLRSTSHEHHLYQPRKPQQQPAHQHEKQQNIQNPHGNSFIPNRMNSYNNNPNQHVPDELQQNMQSPHGNLFMPNRMNAYNFSSNQHVTWDLSAQYGMNNTNILPNRNMMMQGNTTMPSMRRSEGPNDRNHMKKRQTGKPNSAGSSTSASSSSYDEDDHSSLSQTREQEFQKLKSNHSAVRRKKMSIIDIAAERITSVLDAPMYHERQKKKEADDGSKSPPTFVCPKCKTRQRSFIDVTTAASQFESPLGYLALFFGLYLVSILFVFGLEEGWKPLDCIYFAVITLTTAGLGDFVPTSDTAKVICACFIYFGVATIGLLLGSILAGSLDDENKKDHYEALVRDCPNCLRLERLEIQKKRVFDAGGDSNHYFKPNPVKPGESNKNSSSNNDEEGQEGIGLDIDESRNESEKSTQEELTPTRRRQSHTKHMSLSFDTTKSKEIANCLEHTRQMSADFETINENTPFISRSSSSQVAGPALNHLNSNPPKFDENSTSSTSSDSSSNLTKPMSRLKAVKYIIMTLNRALLNSLLIMFIGSSGFMLIEGMTLVDSFYFTTVLLTSVGYGDIVPVSDAGKGEPCSVIEQSHFFN
eukprot:scaffold56552_cov71-Cyclotella_meneghiniana.AAC.1